MTSTMTRLSAAAAAGMFLFGISNALLGAVLPLLAARLGFSLAQSGTLFLVLNFGVLVSVLALGPVVDRWGMKAAMVAGHFIVAAAIWLTSAAPSYRALVAAAFVLGLGGGALNVATNTLTADLHADTRRKSAALNLLGAFFGLGALLIPLGLGALVTRAGLDAILRTVAFQCALAGLYPLALAFPAPKHAEHGPTSHGLRLIRMPVVVVTAMLLFFQSGNEITVAGYATTYLIREIGASVGAASWALTILWISVIVARIALLRVALLVPGRRIVLAGAALAALGALLLLAAGSFATAVTALIIIGAGMAGTFPTTLGMAGALFKERSGSVFGILLMTSRLGAMLVPYAAGQLAEAAGLRAALWMVVGGAAATFALELVRARQAATYISNCRT